jgi:hypothetical protein
VAFGLGDEGSVTVRISQPFGYEFDEFTDLTGFEATEPDAFGTVVYSRSGLDEDDRFVVGLANDDRLVSRPLAVEGVDIQLRSWPDDPDWAEFAAGRVEAGIPALAELIGTAWPVEGSFDVRQTVEPYRAGYAGWFDAQSNEIAVGEALDADTIYHELSHAWINRRLTTERWFTEGLPQVYAAELVRRDGGDARVPSEPTVDDPAAKPLTEWTADDDERPVEEYGYATSFWVLDGLVDEIGLGRIRDVVAGLGSGVSPYGPTDGVERPEQDWQRVYDVLVEIGGSTVAADLFRRFVVDAEDAALIERRDRAAVEVAALAQRSGPWELPIGVRQRLERWELDDVATAVAAADAVLAQRTELEAIEQAVGIDEPDRADVAYAEAPMATSGGVAFAEAESALGAAIELGRRLEVRLGDVADAATSAGVTPPDVSELDGVDDFAGGLAAADEQLRALDGIVELDDRLGETGGLLETIGRWGSDLDGALDDARSHVEAGDTEAALDTLSAADERVDDLARTGALRLALTSAFVALTLLVLVLLVRRRRASPER